MLQPVPERMEQPCACACWEQCFWWLACPQLASVPGKTNWPKGKRDSKSRVCGNEERILDSQASSKDCKHQIGFRARRFGVNRAGLICVAMMRVTQVFLSFSCFFFFFFFPLAALVASNLNFQLDFSAAISFFLLFT